MAVASQVKMRGGSESSLASAEMVLSNTEARRDTAVSHRLESFNIGCEKYDLMMYV